MAAERVYERTIARRQLAAYGRQIRLLVALVLLLLLLGALGLSLSEKVSYWYAFRWALDSAATVGGFRQPHTIAGEVIQVLLVMLGLSTLFYGLALVADLFVAGHLGDLLRLRRTQRMIDSLANHHIVCGFGRVGRQVARDLAAARAKFVVIDSNPESRSLAEGEGILFIEGVCSGSGYIARKR